MQHLKRWLCLTLTLALSISLALPALAADPLADTFGSLLIDAETTDSPQVNLAVDLYSRNSSSDFALYDSVRYNCTINRLAGSALFYIQPNTDGVWVEVDYLTDFDGNGVYEMLNGEDAPVCDVMTASGQLVPWDGAGHPLTNGQIYILSADTLAARGLATLSARTTSGGEKAISDMDFSAGISDAVLYLVSLHYTSASDGEEYVLHYYLRLFDSAIIPSDVAQDAWYYTAVEYVLAQGLFSGTGEDAFSPNGAVTRAQLAQILWRMGGSLQGSGTNFSDVAPGTWYYDAVAWCSQQGLMSGSGDNFLPDAPLTREQLALVLRQYATYAGLNTMDGVALSRFTDGSATSSWALAGMEWAVAKGLLSGYDNGALRPANGITRCELAAVLRTFSQTLLGK